MAVLYVTEPGAVLRKTGESIVVEKEKTRLAEVELCRLETVLLYGPVQVTTQALHGLLRARVELALLSTSGELLGQLTPPLGKNVVLRRAQYERFLNPEYRLRLARELVTAKIRNTLELLKQADWNRPECDHTAVRTGLAECLRQALDAQRAESLLGIEGTAARLWFSVFPDMLRVETMPFHGRSKRPPTDPVNALLSFGYVLLVTHVQALLDATGWDPAMGFYHEVVHGRPSLALDLFEPLRGPVVDRFVLKMVNLRCLKPEDFEQQADGGYRLTRDGLRTFFQQWNAHVKTQQLEQNLRNQQEKLAACLLKDKPVDDGVFFRFHAR